MTVCAKYIAFFHLSHDVSMGAMPVHHLHDSGLFLRGIAMMEVEDDPIRLSASSTSMSRFEFSDKGVSLISSRTA
jgi:hypothetical protein